jgi:hypothetical protein
VTERKIGQYAVIEVCKARHKNDVKIDGERNRKRRKKGGKKREKGEKGMKRKRINMHLLETFLES